MEVLLNVVSAAVIVGVCYLISRFGVWYHRECN